MKDYIQERLFELQDEGYREFQAKLTPGTDIENMIGVRTPQVRALAKEVAKLDKIDEFLDALPHKYYDENNLHALIICSNKSYDETIKRLDEFLPYVDNWATCDIMGPKAFKKNRKLLAADIERWLGSDKTYTVRFGIEMIMTHFLDEDFDAKWLERVAIIRSEEYYINMMIAWFFATALAKQWEATVKYIENVRLDRWTHNKTIQKAVESYRITDEQKKYLRGLKIK